MITKINCDELILEISDEGFNSPGWLSLVIKGDDGDYVHGIDVHIDELLPAIIGFDAKLGRVNKEDQQHEIHN